MSKNTDRATTSSDGRDPRHVFLDAHEVMQRYGWGKTRGYQNLKDRRLVPEPVFIHPNRWRLDQLLAWEERRMAAAEAALEARQRDDFTADDIAARLPRAEEASALRVEIQFVAASRHGTPASDPPCRTPARWRSVGAGAVPDLCQRR